jgi:hypothetical protein
VQLVLVEWLDSRRSEGWTCLEDLLSNLAATHCKSVGWIIARDRSSLTIAGHLADDPEQCCGDMTIPAKAIIKISPLAVTSQKKRKTTA